MSNLIKSGFIAFSQDDTLVIDANKSKVITDISVKETPPIPLSDEEVLAEAMLREAGLDGGSFDDESLLTMDSTGMGNSLDLSSSSLLQRKNEILKAAKADAEDIINKAHEEAEELRQATYNELEQIKQDAWQEGYDQGHSEGLDIANKEFDEKKAELEQYKLDMEIQMQQREEDLVKDTEHKMVDWLCQMIPQITGVVIENQKDVLLYIINAAMRDLDNSKNFVVKVSCDDYEDLSERKDEIYGALNPNINLEIFEDAKLSPMQCLIETDNGIVDVSLDVQLDNLIKVLKLMIIE